MSLKIVIDIEEIAKRFKEFAEEAKQDMADRVERLSSQTKERIEDMAKVELKSSRDKFLDNFDRKTVAPGVHVITLYQPAVFIDDGIDEGYDMKPGMLASPKAKMSKGGKDLKGDEKPKYKYLVVPFDQTKVPTKSRPGDYDIISRIRSKLAEEKIPFKKLELNKDGSPRLGKLHSFNWGGNIPGKGNTGDMQGVSIYQTKTPSGNVRRDIFTFRTVSANPSGGSKDKWIHPGTEGKKFLDRGAEWAMKEWEESILPAIEKKWGTE